LAGKNKKNHYPGSDQRDKAAKEAIFVRVAPEAVLYFKPKKAGNPNHDQRIEAEGEPDQESGVKLFGNIENEAGKNETDQQLPGVKANYASENGNKNRQEAKEEDSIAAIEKKSQRMKLGAE